MWVTELLPRCPGGRTGYAAGCLWLQSAGTPCFGAVSGMSLAANMVFAKIAMPELKQAIRREPFHGLHHRFRVSRP